MDDARLRSAFTHGRPALVAYLMAGFPDRQGCLAAMEAVADAGADLIELGVPFSDPIADGPVIVQAAARARAAHGGVFGLAESISLAAEFITSRPDGPPVALMTYYNTVLRMGLDEAAARARAAGVGGVIVPDLPPDAAGPWLEASRGLDTVFLVAPTSTPERLRKVGEESSGFVYCVSSTGVTGERDTLPAGLEDLVRRVREETDLPVAVGFGISSPEQAARVARVADGVIVGSALVRRQEDAAALGTFTAGISKAVRSAR